MLAKLLLLDLVGSALLVVVVGVCLACGVLCFQLGVEVINLLGLLDDQVISTFEIEGFLVVDLFLCLQLVGEALAICLFLP